MKTEIEIENLLRKAPVPEPSLGFGDKLKTAVRLPQSSNGTDLILGVPFWRRWLPAMGYAVMVLGCVVVLAVQHHQNSAALQQLEELREEVALKEKQVEQQREQARLALAADARLKNLRENATEADRLALTLEELRALIAQLTTEASKLESKLAEVPERNEIVAPYDFFNDPDGPIQKAREEADSIKCVNNMKQIGLALNIWENEHEDEHGNGGWFPGDVNTVSRELSSITKLCCPEDAANRALADQLKNLPDGGWGRWPINGGSYEMFLSGHVNSTTPEVIVARCRFHGHVTHADGSVQRGDTEGVLQP